MPDELETTRESPFGMLSILGSVAALRLIMTVIQGMSTLARDAATREKLTRFSATALRSWPGSSGPPHPREVSRAAAFVR